MSKKIFGLLSALVVIAMIVSACGAPTAQVPGGEEPAAPEQTSPPQEAEAPAEESGEIKIGVLSAFTGVFSAFGEMQRSGYEMALEEFNGEVAGKKIVLIEEDDQLDNELAVTKAKKLVEQDKIDILTGMVSGDEGLTVGDYMKDKGIPVLPMYSASEDMTMRERFPLMVRPSWTGAQPMDVFGYWLAKEKGWKKIYMIGEDYSYPYNQGGGFKRGFCRGGGEEVKSVWHPVPLDDFSSIIASIPLDEGYDAVLYNGAGADAVAFVKQFVELGMLDKITLVGQSNTFEQGDLPAMPTDIVGALSAHLYVESLTSPEAVKFAEAYQAKYNRPPAAAAEFAYTTMILILRAIEAMDGDVSDPEALVQAMKEVDMSDAPRGPVTLDEYNAAVQNVYIREVQAAEDGSLFNQVLYTVENVSQFGPYDPDVYMQQPADAGDFPPDSCADFASEMLTADSEYQFLPFGE